MLAVVPSATLHGLDGRSIRVEVDVAPGLPGLHGRRARRHGRAGSARARPWRDPQRRVRLPAAAHHGQPRAGRAAQDGCVARPGHRHRHPSRLRAGARRRRSRSPSSASSASTARCARCRASCRWSRRSPGAGSGGSWSPRRPSTRRVSSRASTSSALPRLADAAELVRGRRPRRVPVAMPRVTITGPAGAVRGPRSATGSDRAGPTVPDLAEVRGQVEARRGLEIALAGGHGLLLTGPPGVGKTLLARTIPGLLPPLDDAAALSVSIVASAAGEGPITCAPPAAAVPHAAPHAVLRGDGRRRARPCPRARSRAPITACCSSTSWPSSIGTSSRRSVSRSRRAGS